MPESSQNSLATKQPEKETWSGWGNRKYNEKYETWMPWIEDKYLYWWGKDNKASYTAKSKSIKTPLSISCA
jgi:hypothetical protein